MTINPRLLVATLAAASLIGGGAEVVPRQYDGPSLPRSKPPKPPRNKGGKAAIQYANRYQSVPMLSTRERKKADRLAALHATRGG